MSTLTATTAAEQLLGDVRHMLARHDGAESLDELRELADELSTALRRVRGRISRIAKHEQPTDAPSSVAPSAPRSNETAPKLAPSAPPAATVQRTAVTPVAKPEKQPVTVPPRTERTPPMSTPTLASPSIRTNTRRHSRWLLAAAVVLAVIAALVMLAGCSLPSSQDPLPPGSDQVPAVVDTPAPPAEKVTSCDRAREAFLTGTTGEIRSALRALIADKSADAVAREYAQYYLERDANDPELQDMDKGLIQASCS